MQCNLLYYLDRYETRGATPLDLDLLSVIEKWADLPHPVKAGIVAMVRATGR